MAKSKKPPKMKALTAQEVEASLAKLKSLLAGEDKLFELMSDALHGNLWFSQQLELGLLSVAKLKKLFQIQGSEKAINRNPHHSKNIDTDDSSAEPAKGHGRNSADAYKGAKIEDVSHPELSPGDTCPGERCDGRLYKLRRQGVTL